TTASSPGTARWRASGNPPSYEYDAVGVDAFFGPYLRATAAHPELVPGTGVRRRGTWKLYGGVALECSLYAQLPFTIIGIGPSKRIVFPIVSREWPIAEGRIPARP
ncbi:hypothetical protein AB0N17_46535, partial [Streptomyces sp. NPDC051133]